MINRMLGTALIAAVVAFAPASAAEKNSHAEMDKKTHAQTVCPLTGKDINKEIHADHDGMRVYFCCPNCKAAFEKDPAKVMKKLKDEGVTLEKVSHKQTLCPVMGGEINAALHSDADGKRVYFCCAMCKPEFEKDPAKYIQAMEAKGIELEKAPKGE